MGGGGGIESKFSVQLRLNLYQGILGMVNVIPQPPTPLLKEAYISNPSLLLGFPPPYPEG